MEVFDEEKTDTEKIASDDNIIGTGKHCLIALIDCWNVGILKTNPSFANFEIS